MTKEQTLCGLMNMAKTRTEKGAVLELMNKYFAKEDKERHQRMFNELLHEHPDILTTVVIVKDFVKYILKDDTQTTEGKERVIRLLRGGYYNHAIYSLISTITKLHKYIDFDKLLPNWKNDLPWNNFTEIPTESKKLLSKHFEEITEQL